MIFMIFKLNSPIVAIKADAVTSLSQNISKSQSIKISQSEQINGLFLGVNSD